MEQLFATTTDRDGSFSITRKVDPPGFWIDLNVQISATLLEPAGVAAVGTLDIDAEDGTPSNEQRAFRLESGKKTSLGNWRVSLDRNTIRVQGQTLPIRQNTALKVAVIISK